MQIENFQFRPGWLAVVVTLVAVSIFAYLSIWQIGRAEERKQLRDEILKRSQIEITDFNFADIKFEKDRYRRYKLTGAFMNEHQILLDNVVRNGKAGYEVITPFRLTDDSVVLVNRGWITAGRDRRILPETPVRTEPHQIEASLDRPRSAPVVGSQVIESSNRWNYLDLELYRQNSGLAVADYMMLLSPEGPSGYDRNWPQVTDKSGMHIGYAIQWAVFALIALGTFLGMNIKRVKPRNENE